MATRKSPRTRPTQLTLRSYNVGFGDCFLLTFHYAAFDRHVLIDFGSTRPPNGKAANGGAGPYLEGIAKQIAHDCGGKLAAVVATHRHKDHISGFATSKGKGPGAIIRALKPELVIQPWTEDPQAHRDALVPTKALSRTRLRRAQHVRSLHDMNQFAEFALATSERLTQRGLRGAKDELDQLAFLGDDNSLANRDAITNLMTMGKKKPRYVYFGADSGLDALLPGVTTTVLGPPTLEQTRAIAKQRSDDEQFWLMRQAREDFWVKRAAVARKPDVAFEPLFPGHIDKRVPYDARWYQYKARMETVDSMLSLVRTLDAQMNNTSVILLFEVGGKRLLFPGDAQYENWMYALDQDGVRKLLKDVDVYKVGHHGSRNATPKDLWDGFSKRGGQRAHGRLITVLSTLGDVHGDKSRDTEVPRDTLMKALRTQSRLVDTRDPHPKPLVIPL